MARLVTGVRDEQLTDPTPCTKYTVGDLADHIGGLALAFTAAARNEVLPGSEGGGSGDASRLADGWRDRVAADLAALADAWADPASYDGEATAGGEDRLLQGGEIVLGLGVGQSVGGVGVGPAQDVRHAPLVASDAHVPLFFRLGFRRARRQDRRRQTDQRNPHSTLPDSFG